MSEPTTEDHRRMLVYEVNGHKQEFLLEDECTIGRLYENDVVLDGQGVSRRHCKVDLTGDRPTIIDLGSRHGTKVNGMPVTEQPLYHGDVIHIQRFEMVFQDTASDDDLIMPTSEVTFTSGGTSTDHFKIDAGEESLFMGEDVDDLQRANEQLRQIQAVASDMCELMESGALMERILSILVDIFGPDQGAILIYNAEEDKLVPSTTYPQNAGKEIAISRTILEEVKDKKVALLSSDVNQDDRFNAAMSIIDIGITSTMSAPLIAKGNFLGVIYLISLSQNPNFSEHGLQLLMGIANQAAIGIENNRLQEQISDELVLRNQLERYVSAPLVEGLISREITLEPGGNKREVTCMFSDIQGFTALSETLPPEEVVVLLNEYLELMVDAIFEFDGTLDKYAGDGIMAVWGNLIPVENHALSAVNAGKRMLQKVSELNGKRRSENQPEFHVRIGINTGEAVCGNVGSTRRMEYTVIGDTINVASRLESQAAPGSILMSEATFNALAGSATATQEGEIKLKGKEQATPTYSIAL